VKNHEAGTTGRGGTWVVAQFALMIAGMAAGPIWREQWHGWPAFAAGIVLLLLGVWLGMRGKRDLGLNRTPFPQPKQDGQLITTGIYARLRHPLYASVIALGFAWALLWRSWPALGLAVAQVLFFDAKARREERWLRERFPDYTAYTRGVKRFIPGLH
jgi:protein-S-isoprenylcysteine O-methyltransferase Ste14